MNHQVVRAHINDLFPNHFAVVSEHADEAAHLWLIRSNAVRAPHLRLVDLDVRLEAHVDGLRVSGEYGWRPCEAQLMTNLETSEIFAAGVMAFESAIPERMIKVVSAVEGESKTTDGIGAALGWVRSCRRCRTFKIWYGVTNQFISALELVRLRCIGGIRRRRWRGSFGRRIRRCGRGRLDL